MNALSPARQWNITTFYSFQPMDDLPSWEERLNGIAEKLGLTGLVILAEEGINSTLAAPDPEALASFKTWLNQALGRDLLYKDSMGEGVIFRTFKVKRRTEICTLGTPDLVPNGEINHHLPPKEWDRVLKEDHDFVMVDTRNAYEYKIGTFRGAINPEIEQFTELPDVIEEQLQVPKDKKLLIFCTGGIRCEKGLLELQRRGYKKVYQLEGGILKYLEEFPDQEFIGECFVFDERVAVDQELRPSKRYGLCRHCGDPAEHWITCVHCGKKTRICEDCAKLPTKSETCSKNCAYQHELKSASRARKHQQLGFADR